MRPYRNINILLSISVMLFSIFMLSCDDDVEPYEDSETIDCEYCYEEMPQYVDMNLEFNMTLNAETVYFTVFSGYAFTSSVYMTGTSNENSIWISVVPDQKYTIVAEYSRSGRVVQVINDCYVKTEFFKSACDNPCYYVYEAKCDLKLRQHDYSSSVY